MILIKNTQRKIYLDCAKIKKDVQIILNSLHYDDFDIGIWFTTNKTIRSYNREYRHKDKATDILSFSFHPNLKPGEHIQPQAEEDKNLGDLIVSVEYVQQAAQDFDQTLQDRLQVLLVHGICHLLGYDHETDEDYTIMHQKEIKLLKKLKNS
jgi:probable rRNA maturation factor